MREFCRMLVGGGEKRFDFALLAAGYDAGGKSPRAVPGAKAKQARKKRAATEAAESERTHGPP